VKQKLSQNRDENNFKKIIENLEKSDFHMDKVMAEKMKKNRL
jgi:predicted FMN-binding regulatory protein PaiB